jgi:hypothetical protein
MDAASWFDAGAPPYPLDLYPAMTSAEAVPDLHSIGEYECRCFHEQGFLAVESAFDPRVISGMAADFEALLGAADFGGIQLEAAASELPSASQPRERQDTVRKFWKFIDRAPAVEAVSRAPEPLRVLRALMGDEPILFQDMALFKPPLLGREKPWHQDAAYFNFPPDATVVGVWIALDAATVENGCMCVVPGSHRRGPQPHFHLRDWQLCDRDVPRVGSVAIPLPPGGCLFFHGLLHHGTPANRSPFRRRAVQLHYRPAGAVSGSSDERLAIFGGDRRGVTC